MPSNRRRHANAIPLASFATWGIIGLVALGGGLGYVWCKNQLYTTGTEIRAKERELAELKSKNEVARSKIAQLCSTAALQRQYNNGFIDVVPIPSTAITYVENSAPKLAAAELRAVANLKSDE